MLGSENASGYGNIIITEHQNTSVLIFKNGGKCTLKYKCHKKSGYFFCSLINSAPDLLNGIGGKDFFQLLWTTTSWLGLHHFQFSWLNVCSDALNIYTLPSSCSYTCCLWSMLTSKRRTARCLRGNNVQGVVVINLRFKLVISNLHIIIDMYQEHEKKMQSSFSPVKLDYRWV